MKTVQVQTHLKYVQSIDWSWYGLKGKCDLNGMPIPKGAVRKCVHMVNAETAIVDNLLLTSVPCTYDLDGMEHRFNIVVETTDDLHHRYWPSSV